MTATPLTHRNSLFVLFFLNGIVMSSWVTRTPDIRDLLEASTAEMGLVLVGLSAGAMIGVLSGSPLVARFGARPINLFGGLLIALGTASAGIGSGLALAPAVALGLALIGLGMGAGEIGLNVEGGSVEQELGRSALPAMHGCYSLGTVIGALAGMGLTALQFSVPTHLMVVAVIVAIAVLAAIRPMPAGIGVQPRRAAAGMRPVHAPVWRDPRLLLIGFVILALAMAEGTATDWLPILMVDGHGYDPAMASGIYALFAAMMTIGRFGGGWFIDRFGRAIVLGVSAAIGAVGLALVSFVDNPIVAGPAVVLWGLGAALGFPVALSAAGDSGPNPAARMSLAASLGYVAFLVGPPLLGFLGEDFGLRRAILVVLGMVVLAIVATFGIRDQQQPVDGAEPSDSTPATA